MRRAQGSQEARRSKTRRERRRTLLGEQEAEALLEGDALAGPLVVWREAGWVRRLCDLALEDLLEGVGALAALVDGVHEMHRGDTGVEFFVKKRFHVWRLGRAAGL